MLIKKRKLVLTQQEQAVGILCFKKILILTFSSFLSFYLNLKLKYFYTWDMIKKKEDSIFENLIITWSKSSTQTLDLVVSRVFEKFGEKKIRKKK